MKTTKILATLTTVFLLAACTSPFEAVQMKAQTEGFTALLEAVERTAGALSASTKGKSAIDTADLVAAFEEFPGNGFEVTPTATGVDVVVNSGVFAGCSATLTLVSGSYGVSIEDIMCLEPQADTPEPVS